MSQPVPPTTSKTFYRPAFSDIAANMGWKWLSIVPPMALVSMLVMAPGFFWYVLLSKIGWMVFALPPVAFTKTAANLIKSRREPFCIGCGYDLTTLPDRHNCPECGRAYTFAEINAYRSNPQLYSEGMKLHRPAKADMPAFEALPRKRPKARDGVS